MLVTLPVGVLLGNVPNTAFRGVVGCVVVFTGCTVVVGSVVVGRVVGVVVGGVVSCVVTVGFGGIDVVLC